LTRKTMFPDGGEFWKAPTSGGSYLQQSGLSSKGEYRRRLSVPRKGSRPRRAPKEELHHPPGRFQWGEKYFAPAPSTPQTGPPHPQFQFREGRGEFRNAIRNLNGSYHKGERGQYPTNRQKEGPRQTACGKTLRGTTGCGREKSKVEGATNPLSSSRIRALFGFWKADGSEQKRAQRVEGKKKNGARRG